MKQICLQKTYVPSKLATEERDGSDVTAHNISKGTSDNTENEINTDVYGEGITSELK